MNRYIKLGSKGIALLDNSGEEPKLKYVYDVADTQDGFYRTSYRPFIWEMKPEHETVIVEALDKAYDKNKFMGWDSFNGRAMIGNDVGDVIFGLAHELAARYYEDNRVDIGYSVGGSFLDGYDEFNIGVAFKEAFTVSTAFTLMTRCGIDTSEYIENEDFQSVFDFNTPNSVYALGEAVSSLSEEVLREIEVSIKKYEREHSAEREGNHERNNLRTERGLSDTRNNDTENDRNAGEIRNVEEELSQPTQEDSVHTIRPARDSVPSLHDDRKDSERKIETVVDGNDSAEPTAQQNDQSGRLEAAHEQLDSASGKSDLQGTDLQLNNETENEPQVSTQPATQITLFPSVEEQIEAIREAEQTETADQPIAITQEDIDAAIIAWNGDIDSKIRVFEYMHENARARSTADFLLVEYDAGRTSTPSPYSKEGLHIVKNDAEPITMPWAKVQRRIAQLADEGRFLTSDEKTLADNRLQEVWDNLTTESALQETAEISTPEGIILTQAVINNFTSAETLYYATDKDGALFISNGYFIMRTAEQDIEKISKQINGRRTKNIIEPRENQRIMEYIKTANGNFELHDQPHVLKGERRSAYVYSDNKQYFQYDKGLIDTFQFTDNRLYVDDNSSFDIRSHNLIVKNNNGGVLGLVMPVKTDEALYERLADVLPLETPWKSEVDRIREP